MKKTPAPKPIADFGQEDDAFAKLVEDRSQRSTEHLFRLIALALDKEAIERAFKGVLSGDKLARGTALEYLENVLPADLWEALSPLVDAGSQ